MNSVSSPTRAWPCHAESRARNASGSSIQCCMRLLAKRGQVSLSPYRLRSTGAVIANRMARPRHLLPGLLACLLLAACGDKGGAHLPSLHPRPAAPAPAARAPVAAAPKVAAAPWRPNVPVIDPAQAEATLRQADEALARGQIDRGRSPGPGALELYLAVLAVAPDDSRARSGAEASVDALLEL